MGNEAPHGVVFVLTDSHHLEGGVTRPDTPVLVTHFVA